MAIIIKIVIVYLIVMNILGFASMGIDKQKAKKGTWRISERTLFLFAILGGALGSILGMRVFHHKTRHKQFVIGMPLVLAVHIIIILILVMQLRGKESSVIDFSMGTVVSATIYGPHSDNTCNNVILLTKELDESYLSWRNDNSTISKLNHELQESKKAVTDVKTATYIKDSLKLCGDSGGALDITIHPLIQLWGIETGHPAAPKETDILQISETYDYSKIQVNSENHVLAENTGLSIDLGAVGKGIAADEVRMYLERVNAEKGTELQNPVTGAVVAIGGTVLVYGNKPGNQSWQVGIRDPRGNQDEYLGYLTLKETTVVSTSGDYEQYFEEDGVRYHHIFDPDTGYPANQNLMSVTVVCDSGIYSDGLSTACFVLGYETSLDLLEKYNAEAIFVTCDKDIYVTDGLYNDFTLTNNHYTLR